MDNYATPRPVNEGDDYQIPRYVNVGRSVETELRYVAFQEEREREMGITTSLTEAEQKGEGEKEKTTGTMSRRGKACRTMIIVTVALAITLISVSALILGVVTINKPRRNTDVMTGSISGNSSHSYHSILMENMQLLPAVACFSNSTMCNTGGESTNDNCSILGTQQTTTEFFFTTYNTTACKNNAMNTNL